MFVWRFFVKSHMDKNRIYPNVWLWVDIRKQKDLFWHSIWFCSSLYCNLWQTEDLKYLTRVVCSLKWTLVLQNCTWNCVRIYYTHSFLIRKGAKYHECFLFLIFLGFILKIRFGFGNGGQRKDNFPTKALPVFISQV